MSNNQIITKAMASENKNQIKHSSESVIETGSNPSSEFELLKTRKISADLEHEILKKVPQANPFRFIDTILDISCAHAVGQYTFKREESFYIGHFPKHAVTPGVILLETMAQIGLVTMAIFLELNKDGEKSKLPEGKLTFFCDSLVDFLLPVYPLETVTVASEKMFFRHGKLKAKVDLYRADGQLAASGQLSGISVNPDNM